MARVGSSEVHERSPRSVHEHQLGCRRACCTSRCHSQGRSSQDRFGGKGLARSSLSNNRFGIEIILLSTKSYVVDVTSVSAIL